MIETVKRVVCDRCGKGGPIALESEDPAQIARDADWIVYSDCDELRTDGGGDYCPTCNRAAHNKFMAEAKAARDQQL